MREILFRGMRTDGATLMSTQETPGQTITDLRAKLKITEQQLNAVATEWDNERKLYQDASAKLKQATERAERAEGDALEMAELTKGTLCDNPKEDAVIKAQAIIDKYKNI